MKFFAVLLYNITNLYAKCQTDLSAIKSCQTIIKVALQLEYSYPGLDMLISNYKIVPQNDIRRFLQGQTAINLHIKRLQR